MMREEFRSLDESLLPAVVEIERASNASPWSENSFRAEIGSSEGEFLVLLSGGTPVGFGGYWAVVDEPISRTSPLRRSTAGEASAEGSWRSCSGELPSGAWCAARSR